MNNNDNRPERRLATPEQEQAMRETLNAIRTLADTTTVESPWIIDTNGNSNRITVVASRNGSKADTPIIKRDIQLQPNFPLSLAKDWDYFVAQRQEQLTDVKHLIEDLILLSHLPGKA